MTKSQTTAHGTRYPRAPLPAKCYETLHYTVQVSALQY